MSSYTKLAVISSATPAAREAEAILREQHEFVPLDQADAVIVLGGDGHLLQTLHQLLESRRDIPAYGMNRGTVGFLMNNWEQGELLNRLAAFRQAVPITAAEWMMGTLLEQRPVFDVSEPIRELILWED